MKAKWVLLALLTTLVGCSTTERSKTDKLVDYAKTFGYIKYFYPGEEAAKMDWDRFGAYACEQLLAEDNEVTINELFNWAPKVWFDNDEVDSSFLHSLSVDNSVFWQHVGNGEGKVGPFYKSTRINRQATVLPDSPNDYGLISQRLEVEKVQAKEIHAQAKVRLSSTYQGLSFLSLRYKEKDKPWQEIRSHTISGGTGEWVVFDIATSLPPTLEQARYSVFSICRAGYADVDEITFAIVDGPNQEKLIEENFRSSTIETAWRPFGPNQEFKLVAHNGENEYLRISRNQGDLKSIPPLYDPQLPHPKIIRKRLSDHQSITFPLVLPAGDSTTALTTVSTTWKVLDSVLNNLDPAELSLEYEHVRLANIIKTWNVFQHFYPYFDVVKVDWEKALRTAIEQNQTDTNIAEHLITLKRMVSRLQDSHIGVYHSKDSYFPPFVFEWIENQLVITTVADSITNLQPGQIITSVNGMEASDFWRKKLQQSSGANAERRNYKGVVESLEGQPNDSISLTLAENEMSFTFPKILEEDTFDELSSRINALGLGKICPLSVPQMTL